MCTSIVVGERATADSSFLIARSADSSSLKAQHFLVHDAFVKEGGWTYSCKAHQGLNDFTWPMPEKNLRFTTVCNWKTQLHGAAGFNELGVGLTGTESIFARDDALALDPYNKATGISEDDIPDVILPQATSAKAACALLGHIIETAGCAEGFGVGFIDAHDVWYLETGTGHQWLAHRCPADQYFASGNQGRLRAYDPTSDAMMASKTLVSWAKDHGFYDETAGDFDFAAAYTRNDDRDRTYNDPRVWVMQKRFNPSLEQAPDTGRDYAVYLTPEKPVTVADLIAVMRDHYIGTDHDPYSNGLNGNEPWRPISVFRTYEAHVLQVKPELPKEIGCVLYVAFGMADLSCFIPFYQGLDAVPAEFGLGTDHADNESVYWKFRKLQTLAMTDYPTLAPIVHEAVAAHEAKLFTAMAAFEKAYVAAKTADETAAHAMLQTFNASVIADTLALVDSLTNELFTQRTADIEKANFFANRKKKD